MVEEEVVEVEVEVATRNKEAVRLGQKLVQGSRDQLQKRSTYQKRR